MSKLTKSVVLPTAKYLYPELEKITLNEITVEQEMLLYGMDDPDSENKLIKSLVQEIIDPVKLTSEDRQHILFNARMLTYGEDYNTSVTCYKCNQSTKTTVKLGKINMLEIEEDFECPKEIKLSNDDTLLLTIPTYEDYEIVNEEIEIRLKSKTNKFTKAELNYLYNLMVYISKINGEELNAEELFSYVKTLRGKDSSLIKDFRDSINFGYDLVQETTCSNPMCKSNIRFRINVDLGFFRS
jgi:hypothetical protein